MECIFCKLKIKGVPQPLINTYAFLAYARGLVDILKEFQIFSINISWSWLLFFLNGFMYFWQILRRGWRAGFGGLWLKDREIPPQVFLTHSLKAHKNKPSLQQMLPPPRKKVKLDINVLSNLNSVSVNWDDHSLDSKIQLYKIHIILELSGHKVSSEVRRNWIQCISITGGVFDNWGNLFWKTVKGVGVRTTISKNLFFSVKLQFWS